jgi:hypothetical protein
MRIDANTAETLKPWFPELNLQSVSLVQGGPICWLVRHVLRQGAMTFDPFVFYGRARFEPAQPRSLALLAHELKHVEQYRALGHAGFLARYLMDRARNGFRYGRELPLEKEAYDLQDEVLRALAGS